MGFLDQQRNIDDTIIQNLLNKVYQLNSMCQENNLKTGYALFFDPSTTTLAFVISPSGDYQVYSLDGCEVLAQGDPMLVDHIIHVVSLTLQYQLGLIGGWS